MGKFNEYLIMVHKGLQNLPNVVEANINYYKNAFGALPQDEKDEAERRYNICLGCPFMSERAKAANFYPTERTDQHCSVCKCPIEKKVMSFNERCGLSLLTELRDTEGREIVSGWTPLWEIYKQ